MIVVHAVRLAGSLVGVVFWVLVSCLVVGPRGTWRAFQQSGQGTPPASSASETCRRSPLRFCRVDRSHAN